MLTPSPARVRPDLPPELVGLGAFGHSAQSLGACGEELLAPSSEQRLGDLMLAAELCDRSLSAQRCEHQLALLLRA
jgi:hypothetical protein